MWCLLFTWKSVEFCGLYLLFLFPCFIVFQEEVGRITFGHQFFWKNEFDNRVRFCLQCFFWISDLLDTFTFFCG